MSRKLMRTLMVLIAFLAINPLCAFAAVTAETRAFDFASKSFNDKNFARAEREFSEFTTAYTNSALLPEAFLNQAVARLNLSNYDGATQLLNSHLASAGKLADQYYFWLGEIWLAQNDPGKYQLAIDWFSRLQKEYPSSPRALEAAVEQAAALAKLNQPQKVIELLAKTNGLFQSTARTNQASKDVLRGDLLLSQAFFAEKKYEDAEKTLERYGRLSLEPKLAWQRQFLLCRIQIADNRPEQALSGAINLLSIAAGADLNDLKAESTTFRAGILESLKRYDEAVAAYTNNLVQGISVERQREAVLKIAELSLTQNKLTAAVQWLEEFLVRYPDAPTADLAWLTVGELHLREYLASSSTNGVNPSSTNTAGGTNSLQQAQVAFETLTKKLPQSPLVPKGHLNLGWCYWLANKLSDAETAFGAAAQTLPVSVDQARALFKLADTQFRLKDYTNALTNYQAVFQKFNLAEIKTNFFEPALYQAVRAGLATGTPEITTNALARLLADFPEGFHTDRAVLIWGQDVSERGNPAAARQIFSEFLQRAPNARLRPEVELAIARTFEQESKWTEAVQQYEHWVSTFTNHVELPRAEYFLAWDNDQMGAETIALTRFTNLIARFPTNEFASLAQWWVADFYYRTARLPEAENNYQLISQNNPGSEIGYQAQLMAGRVAVARQGWSDASNYFSTLANDKSCPIDLRLEAKFAFGDTLVYQDSTNKLKDYQDAAAIFNDIESSSSNRLAILACGQKANCMLQYAQKLQQTNELTTSVIASFQKIANSLLADATTRSIAKVGIGVVLEKQGNWQKAKDEYLDVFYEKLLRDGERPSPFWTKSAGLDAARLAEDHEEWDQAFSVYKRLLEKFPELSGLLQTKIIRARKYSIASH